MAEFRPKPEHQGAPGILHGGVAATCLDETMAALGFVLRFKNREPLVVVLAGVAGLVLH